MSEIKKINKSAAIHTMVGLAFMLLFPLLPPIEPITKVGMIVAGAFIGMVYLWSTVDSVWPSALGLLIIALSGYLGEEITGYAAVKNVFLNAYGTDTVLLLVLGLVLFGGVEYVGCTKYFARFFLTRKIINGRPYAFFSMVFLCSFLLSGLTNPLASLLILWPIMIDVMGEFGVKKGETPFYAGVVGIYLAATLGQPMFPFKGAALVVVSAYEKLSGTTVSYPSYIAYNVIMSMILLACYLMLLKLVFRMDVSTMKTVNTEQFTKEKLPPMSFSQKCFMAMIVCYVTLLLLPSFLPKTFVVTKWLNSFGTLGITILCVVVLMILQDGGKPVLQYGLVAKKCFNWGIYFMVGAAVYAANAVSNKATGITAFLLDYLQPLLGDKPVFVFIFLLLAFALITTNFANNAGMAVVLLPVVMAFADQYPTVNTVVICMSITMMVFVAILTPAASPYCGMLHARTDAVSLKEIVKLGFPMCVIAVLVYTFIGFPIANILF